MPGCPPPLVPPPILSGRTSVWLLLVSYPVLCWVSVRCRRCGDLMEAQRWTDTAWTHGRSYTQYLQRPSLQSARPPHPTRRPHADAQRVNVRNTANTSYKSRAVAFFSPPVIFFFLTNVKMSICCLNLWCPSSESNQGCCFFVCFFIIIFFTKCLKQKWNVWHPWNVHELCEFVLPLLEN